MATKTKTRTDVLTFSTYPSEETIRTRAEKFAASVDGTVISISSKKVGVDRRRKTRWSVTVKIAQQTN